MEFAKLFKIIILVFGIGITSLSFLFFRSKRKEITLGLFSFIFIILLLEIFIKLFYPQITEHKKMFEYDPYLGWKFIPNKKGLVVHSGEANHYIETNSFGFRDGSFLSDKNKIKKIMVLGDSFVSNLAVRDSEVFTEVLEQSLKNTEVLNFGVNGYGQVQEYLLLQKMFFQIKPDLIILMIYIRNDFNDNIGNIWRYPRPTVSWDEEHITLKINPTPQPSPSNKSISNPLWRKSHLYMFFDTRLKMLTAKISKHEHKPSDYTPPELYLCRLQSSEDIKVMYRTMEELLLRIARFADEMKVPLVFAIAPSSVQVEDELWSSTILNSGEKLKNYIRTLPNDKLMEFAEKKNLLMIDLLPILQSEANKGKTLYNRKEQHWNSYGNHVVAHALLSYLKAKSIVKQTKL